MRFLTLIACSILIAAVACVSFSATAQEKNKKRERDEPKTKPLPNDPELLALHRDFVKSAEKLAFKYEKEKEWSKAKDCYEEILKLVPAYPPARQKVADLLQMEATAKNVMVAVSAKDKEWKDTGVTVQEGRPITIRANGTWTFRMTAVVGAQGIRIPDELREFDPGSLVGMIVPMNKEEKEPKPFMVGPEKQMIAPTTGRLLLRMYDFDMRDNEGELNVEIKGTFQSEDSKSSKGKDK